MIWEARVGHFWLAFRGVGASADAPILVQNIPQKNALFRAKSRKQRVGSWQ